MVQKCISSGKKTLVIVGHSIWLYKGFKKVRQFKAIHGRRNKIDNVQSVTFEFDPSNYLLGVPFWDRFQFLNTSEYLLDSYKSRVLEEFGQWQYITDYSEVNEWNLEPSFPAYYGVHPLYQVRKQVTIVFTSQCI